MLDGEAYMMKAKLYELGADDVQLHDVNVHWLEFEIFTGETDKSKA